MQLNYKWAGVLIIVVGAVTAGAYSLGRRQAESPALSPLPNAAGAAAQAPGSAATAAATVPATLAANEAAQGATGMPPNHPTAQPQAEALAGKVQTEGKVNVDPTQKFTHFRVGNKNVKSILADGKVMWVGTSGGVIRYDTSTDQFKLYDAKNGLLSNGIFHVGKLQGRVAVGTYGGGMSIFDEDKKQWKTFNIPDGLGDAFVYDFLQTANGDIWVATWSGVNRVRGGALNDRTKWDLFTVENTHGGLPNDWVYGLAEGKNGEIWLATEGGLARFKDGKWENWNHEKGLGAPFEKVKNDIQFKSDPSKVSAHHARQKEEMGLQGVNISYNPNYIISLVVDRDGVVWAGTWGGGLARFDGSKWRNYTVADGLPGDHVFMLHLDRKGRLWVGTNNGLARFNNGKFSTMTTADGLFSNAVFSMATGDDGTPWIGSFGGVAHLRGAVPD